LLVSYLAFFYLRAATLYLSQCLQNIRAALEMLGDKASMPVEHLFSEEHILKGKTSVIVPLLFQIRKAFGHHLGKSSSST
jgi:hypothetical protein